jgi:class 3 adenylate cyclase
LAALLPVVLGYLAIKTMLDRLIARQLPGEVAVLAKSEPIAVVEHLAANLSFPDCPVRQSAAKSPAALDDSREAHMSASSIPSDLAGRAASGRKLVAIVYADVVGYSRLIELDDIGTSERLRALRNDLLDPEIERHGGRVIQTAGDSLLIVFDSITEAVQCAVDVQRKVPTHEAGWPADRRVRFRVGIDFGDIVADGTDLHGNGVIMAVRLQAVCPAGSVCVSRSVRDHVRDRLDVSFEELGELSLKNMSRPVEAFALLLDAGIPAP